MEDFRFFEVLLYLCDSFKVENEFSSQHDVGLAAQAPSAGLDCAGEED